ncbi:MAG: heparan-alpha-glucosaminide N-acetyltransferase domain-containing protein [Methanoregula sp.]|nr:heparan-alpha-glucosaminide N-acetyltransferase domain-containing protein [Methanoregula sp.]
MTETGTPNVIPFRDIPVDVLRGLAITIMVGANLIPHLLVPPAPFWLRFLSSVAAPLFIFLSGMMVALSCRMKRYTFSYFIRRGGFVILIAVFLDLFVLGTVPFIDTDVLYLIGISLPLAYLFLKLGLRTRLGILIAILAAAPLLQGIVGYNSLPVMIPVVSLLQGGILPGISTVLSQWFIGGWFPIFPWLALSLMGAQAGMFRWKDGQIQSFAQRKLALLAGSVLVLGALFWSISPGPMLTRYGYVELFYPPTMDFVFFITGLIVCLFIIADILPVSRQLFDPFRALGECSLAIYILHIVIIEWLISPLELQEPLLSFLGGYLLLIAGMIIAAYVLRYIRKKIRFNSFIIRALIGG